MRICLSALFCLSACYAQAATADLKTALEPQISQLMPQIINWRRDLHQHPELSNREFRTSELVAKELKKLGLEVQTGIAHTGVVGILKGGKPGPVVALRADMDALPVTEQVEVPFASKAKAEFNGQQVGVMHACGHDAHVAMLLGAATVLKSQQKELAGTVMFIFQPAEEGPPAGEEGGAALMLKQGLFKKFKPDAIFGVHVWPGPSGQLQVKDEGIMAAADSFEIKVKGVQVHGSSPWRGVDPVAVTGQLITALHQIPARQLDVTKAPAVLSIGQVNGGVRWNIIPDQVTLGGTVRTFDPDMREQLLSKMKHTAEHIAAASGASAEFSQRGFAAVTWNDVKLTQWAMPSLKWAGRDAGVAPIKPITASEDFSFYQQQVPGVFFFLGINEPGVSVEKTAPNHSPFFKIHEPAMENGVRALTALAVDFLDKK
ncbi:amidohydrolase [Rheinheimera sp. 4Y26]|uniref:amidohydrolase n=1 Tax=Rheinheimera sp. 4Y26 TaxID=2977811 RepID=UPI0021B0BED9|nr:amidohydrolase [Rheinheimera sp. 4Y26]MCT6698683.1 amidohydrolase [Rheinheimera sp. 4Y26]